jgi:hypothetical protein
LFIEPFSRKIAKEDSSNSTIENYHFYNNLTRCHSSLKTKYSEKASRVKADLETKEHATLQKRKRANNKESIF